MVDYPKKKAGKGAKGDPPTTAQIRLRNHLDSGLIGLRNDRNSWFWSWCDLAEYMLPRRMMYLSTTPNRGNRGSNINQTIIDSTATIASRTLAAGMMTGITSPSRPWFALEIPNTDLQDSSPVKIWCDEARDRMMTVMAESNYYTSKATQYQDIGVFGTAPMIIYEDFNDVIRCFTPAAGEYFVQLDDAFRPCALWRQFAMTVPQVVQMFGLENCSATVQTLYRSAGASWTKEIIVCHCIEPNQPIWNQDGTWLYFDGIPKSFEWREVYWEYGQAPNLILRAKGYHEKPFSVPRWDVLANDAYGRSPGMDALGDVKQLQVMTKREGQAIEKMVNPPLLADVQMKNQPASALAGGITYVANLSQTNAGMKPLYEVQPRLGEFLASKQEVQKRIQDVFFVPLFLMISQLDTVRTATEIDARREEKLVQLGPVLERFQNESLDQDIDRIFNVMLRAGLFPPIPKEMQGQHIQVRYVSMLAQAQAASSTSAIERLVAMAGNMSAGFGPQVLDNIDSDETLEIYADALGVSPKIIRDTIQVMKMRKQREQAAAAQAAVGAAAAAVEGAHVLSQTPVGSGATALDLMLGNQDAPQARAA